MLPVGHVPEVNGRWAVEMREFVSTRGELLVIAEHWAGVAIERTDVEWAKRGVFGQYQGVQTHLLAWRRVHRIRALLGDVIDRMVDNKIREFYEEPGPSRDQSSRSQWGESWLCPRSAGCIIATNEGPPETSPSLI